jgi:hypothetical protein
MNLLPAVDGRIERRLLVNYRVDPAAVAARLPAGLRPHTVDGWAVAGLCLLRLADLRPPGMPAAVGIATENVAHRVAVTWDGGTGVWIPQRHSSSRLTVRFGGRLFPAVHRRAAFSVHDDGGSLSISADTDDGRLLSVACRPAASVPPGSVFDSTAAARTFFAAGATGLSPARTPGPCDTVDLTADLSSLEPVDLVSASSSLLAGWWPDGEWDSAFLLRDIPCRWSTTGPPSRVAA